MLRYIHIKPKTFEKKKNYFKNETFASKFLIKLAEPSLSSDILCVQILKFQIQNRSKTDIERTLAYLRKLDFFYQFLCIQDTISNVDNILREFSWAAFFKYYKSNMIIKRKGEKLDWFYVIFDGAVTALDFVFNKVCLSEEEYLVHLIKLELLHENEMVRQIKVINSDIFYIREKTIEEFCEHNKAKFGYKQLKETALESLRKYNLDFDKVKTIQSPEMLIETTKISPDQVSHPEKSKAFRVLKKYYNIPHYQKVSVITKTHFFGDLSYNKDYNDNYTYISNHQTELCYINKSTCKQSRLFIYIKDKMERLINHVQNSFYIFQGVSEETFLQNYSLYLSYKQFKKGDKLLLQDSLYKGVYLVQDGEFNVSTSRSYDELNNLMMSLKFSLEKFGEYISSLNTEQIDFDTVTDMSNRILTCNEFLSSSKKKKDIQIATMRRKDVIGMNEYYNYKTLLNNFTVECTSEGATVFFISKEHFNMITSKEPSVRERVSQMVELKVVYFIHTLRRYKEDFIKDIQRRMKNHIELPSIRINNLNSVNKQNKTLSVFSKTNFFSNTTSTNKSETSNVYGNKKRFNSTNHLKLFVNDNIRIVTEGNERKDKVATTRNVNMISLKTSPLFYNKAAKEEKKYHTVHSSKKTLNELKMTEIRPTSRKARLILKTASNAYHRKSNSSVNNDPMMH